MSPMQSTRDPGSAGERPDRPAVSMPSLRPEGAARPGLAGAVRDLGYDIALRGLGAWALYRHRRRFDAVERFCLFVGYPRSGHSVVGTMLNAHPDAVVAHELNVVPHVLGGCTRDELYARILARAFWFDWRGSRTNYDYRVPNQWQGRFRDLRVIGDKRGGAVTRCLAEHPDFLERVRKLVGVPLRLVHVVRNPFDNIAAISLWHGLSLDESVRFYFDHLRTTARLGDLCDADELLTVRHEDMIAAPAPWLVELCEFVGLAPEPGYVGDCSRIVFRAPTRSRRRLDWPPALRREVERQVRAHPFLDGYEFDRAEGPG